MLGGWLRDPQSPKKAFLEQPQELRQAGRDCSAPLCPGVLAQPQLKAETIWGLPGASPCIQSSDAPLSQKLNCKSH